MKNGTATVDDQEWLDAYMTRRVILLFDDEPAPSPDDSSVDEPDEPGPPPRTAPFTGAPFPPIDVTDVPPTPPTYDGPPPTPPPPPGSAVRADDSEWRGKYAQSSLSREAVCREIASHAFGAVASMQHAALLAGVPPIFACFDPKTGEVNKMVESCFVLTVDTLLPANLTIRPEMVVTAVVTSTAIQRFLHRREIAAAIERQSHATRGPGATQTSPPPTPAPPAAPAAASAPEQEQTPTQTQTQEPTPATVTDWREKDKVW